MTTAFLKALHGPRGELDAWLECRSEDEIRKEFLPLINDEQMPTRKELILAALQGLCANKDSYGIHQELIAEEAIQQADAVIAALKKEPK